DESNPTESAEHEDTPLVDGTGDDEHSQTAAMDAPSETETDIVDGAATENDTDESNPTENTEDEDTPLIDGTGDGEQPQIGAESDTVDGGADARWGQVTVEDIQSTLGRDTLWTDDDPKQRGRDYEVLCDANIGGNFPVIDDIDRETGTATSIKTLDPRMASYQNISHLKSTVRNYVNDLSDFSDTTWHVDGKAIEVLEEDVQQRVLHLAMPDGGASDEQKAALEELHTYAESKGVILETREIL
ncbi:MAG: hypothetical protein CV045_09915, partial [Cyanobacteria bacterium M5B4]